ncbi:MAG: DUF58 domain-containing protein [Planctomycetia bacterium]
MKARQIIEGLVSGAHKSPFQGVSVEFAQHREYVAGDDTRHIDWKLYGKTGKFYLKQYEQETNLVCNLVVDASQSMNYTSGGPSKLDYANQAAAALAYLVLHQQDMIGLATFEDAVRHLVPPSSQMAHLKQLLHILAVCKPANLRSKIGGVFDELAERFRRRSLVMVFSDCFDDVDGIVRGLKHLRHRRHEVVLFHVLDKAELEFPFQDMTRFRGLEDLPKVLVEPRALRKAYLEEFDRFQRELRNACRSANVDYILFRTDQPLDRALSGYLAERLTRSN